MAQLVGVRVDADEKALAAPAGPSRRRSPRRARRTTRRAPMPILARNPFDSVTPGRSTRPPSSDDGRAAGVVDTSDPNERADLRRRQACSSSRRPTIPSWSLAARRGRRRKAKLVRRGRRVRRHDGPVHRLGSRLALAAARRSARSQRVRKRRRRRRGRRRVRRRPRPAQRRSAPAAAIPRHREDPEGQRERVQRRPQRRRQDPREPGRADAVGAHRAGAGERQGRRHPPLRHPSRHAARRARHRERRSARRRSTASTWRAPRRRSRRTRASARPTTSRCRSTVAART